MSESNSNGIGDGGHHSISSGKHNGGNVHGKTSKMDNNIDAMIAEEEDLQLDTMIAKNEDMQLDYLFDERKPQKEGEDQAILNNARGGRGS